MKKAKYKYTVPQRFKRTENDIARFWRYVDRKGPDDCWMWTGSTGLPNPCGMVYGTFGVTLTDGRSYAYRAHRFAWMLANGELPKGLVVMHQCDTPLCVNPHHLVCGTQRDNIQDQIDKGRWLCGEDAGRAKLTEAQVKMMRKSKLPHTHFSRLFGVSASAIGRARSGQKWASVK